MDNGIEERKPYLSSAGGRDRDKTRERPSNHTGSSSNVVLIVASSVFNYILTRGLGPERS